MLKFKYVAFLFCFISTIANAEPFKVEKSLVCDKLSEVLRLLPNYNEVIEWQGKTDRKLITLLSVNKQTQSWTIITTDGEHACILDQGQGFTVKTTPAPSQEKNNKPNMTL